MRNRTVLALAVTPAAGPTTAQDNSSSLTSTASYNSHTVVKKPVPATAPDARAQASGAVAPVHPGVHQGDR